MGVTALSCLLSVIAVLLCRFLGRKIRRLDHSLTLLHTIVAEKITLLEQTQAAWNTQSRLRDTQTTTRLNDIDQYHFQHPSGST